MSDEAVAGNASELKKTVGLYGAVALALGIVVGAGMLSLPGLVYGAVGGWAVYAWLLDGALVLPLLFVFAVLGRRFPGAGGVAGFVSQAFAWMKPGCAYLLLGAFSIGLPGIAITGAGYITGAMTLPAGWDPNWATTALAGLMMAAVLAIAWIGARFAGSLQNVVVTLLVGCLAVIAALSLPEWGSIDFSVGDPSWTKVWTGMGLAFFAYTGWEMLSFMTEEFKNPQRDFPLAVGISFLVILGLYLGAALAVQAHVPLDDERLGSAPFLAVIDSVLGSKGAIVTMAALVLAIIVTNLNGAIWAASRLVFDIGRDGWAPGRLALQKVSGEAATPRRALLLLAAIFTLVLLLHGFGVLTLTDLLRTAGQNFFLLYTLAIAAFIRIEPGAKARAFGLSALLVCIAFGSIFGWGLLYAAVLFAAPYAFRGALR